MALRYAGADGGEAVRAARVDANKFDLTSRYGRYRARKAGFDVPKQKPGSKPKDIWDFIQKTEGCWLWSGPVNAWGYGRVSVDGRTQQAHRLSWEQANGRKIGPFIAMHTCDTPACCNPAHILIGTHSENQRDKFRKNRQAKGQACGSSKLTESQVLEIRASYKFGSVTFRSLAEKYGVCRDTIRKAVRRVYWRHI